MVNNGKEIGFECKPPYASMLFRALIFALGTVLSLWYAKVHSTRPVGLIINGVIELGPTGAKYFYIVMTVFAFGAAVWYAHQGIKLLSLPHPKYIHLDIDDLVFNVGFWSSQQYKIPYSDITKIFTSKIDGKEGRLTIVFHQNQLQLYKAYFKSNEDWNEIKRLLLYKVKDKKQSVQPLKEKKKA